MATVYVETTIVSYLTAATQSRRGACGAPDIDARLVAAAGDEFQRARRRKGALPEKATVDAFHIGVAAAHSMTYLLTWNCKHLANAAMRSTIESVCRAEGLTPPIICTPEELPAARQPL